jgi:dTDP-4-dehydrorhamnose reductase
MQATPRRWLITGASGRLGKVLAATLAQEAAAGASVMSTTRSGEGGSVALDMSDLHALAQMLDALQPTHIVHLAGISSPAVVARDPERARVVNVDATVLIADWARRHGAWMLFTSSDMVFDGAAAPYDERATLTPTTFYGQCKAQAEASVLAAQGTVARLAWMIGCPDPAKDFITSALQKLASGTPVSAAEDEWRTPISFQDAAEAVMALGQMRHVGIVNVAGREAVTAHGLLYRSAQAAGLDTSLVRAVSRSTLEPVGRPPDIRLDSSRLQALLALHAAATRPPVMAQAAQPAPRLTVIIPVYNGARFLPATLRALSQQIQPGMRVVVVPNGCRDDSAAVARRELATHMPGHDTHVVELAQGSRNGALNAGDALASGTRVMLDQDALLGPGALAALARAIDRGAHFATGRLAWGGVATWPVRLALSAWSEMPYVKHSPVSAGLYAFSSTARDRFDRFPLNLPDDKWVRLLCPRAERRRLEEVVYTVNQPGNFAELVAARRRYAKSNHQLAAVCPELLQRDGKKSDGLIALALRPDLWPGISMLTMAEVMARSQLQPEDFEAAQA